MAVKLTAAQQNAVDAKGNILVAAAAGSGKTAVLVERVISKLCSKTDPVSADRLLIVTFTNAAAAEMRGRIEKRLNEECRKEPDNAALLRQKHLLSSAKICTIDSFCIDLVRENFQKAGVSPDFKITDAHTLRAYDEKVMSDIINRYLQEENPTFLALLDIIGAEYDDFNFLDFALNLYYDSRIIPFPSSWLDTLPEFYSEGKFTPKNPWYTFAFSTARTVVKDAVDSLSAATDLISVNEKAYEKYMPVFSSSMAALAKLWDAADSNDWDAFYHALNSFSLPDLPRVMGLSGVYEISAAKNIYKHIADKAFSKLSKIFYADNAFIDAQFSKLYEPIRLLAEILKEFEQEVFAEYLKQNSLTFHTTEQLALSLLCERVGDEVVIKEDAVEFLDRFDEVMVDEYQDTNDLQDMLFYVLSNKEKKLFAVGDVKQSIYGFRGANPANFLKKKNRYIPIDLADSDSPQKIILSNNFRCKSEVCDFVNFFFEGFMTQQTGNIIYDSEERLVPAAEYPETEQKAVSFSLIDCKNSDIPSIIAESRKIAEYIKKVMASGDTIRVDKDTLRPARYSDFTILLRSVKNKAPIMAAELKRQGIPISYSNESFAESVEIATVLSLLKIIDNPQSDIELITALMSPLFGFSPEDLAKIRAGKKDGNIYSAVIFAAENGDIKANAFLDTMEKYRLFAAVSPIAGVISFILQDTGYLDAVSAMPDGSRRRSNLLLLCNYAEQYSDNNPSSLGGFVRYILKQSESGIKSAGSATVGDTVNIMSIHASKGLQFPVCIVAGTASAFNANETLQSTLYTTDFGIGFKYFDEELKEKFSTVGREVILEKLNSERLQEELRLLYVAMTRTQDKLFFTAAVSNAEKKLDELKTLLISSNSEITSALFSRTKSYLDWLLISLLLHPDGKSLRGTGTALLVRPTLSKIEVEVCTPDEEVAEKTVSEISDDSQNSEITQAIMANAAFEYPYKDVIAIESKASVSAIANKAESVKYAFSGEPTFMTDGKLKGAKRGTALHKVMQFFDFSKADDIESEIERLKEWQFIAEDEADAIDRKALGAFFASDIFRRIRASELVKREMRFLTEVPAKRIAPQLPQSCDDEKIIVQGAVDLCFTESDGVVILDFKTDRVQTEEALKEAYAEQLNIYATACEKIFEKPVKEKIIYSFSLSKEIKL